MMRKFKALKLSSLTHSTQSVNNLDYVGNDQAACSTSNQSDSSLLEGTIDLKVLLPYGRQIRMPIDARTPMMDVLVQVTSANGINAGGMMLTVPIDRPPGYLRYKPNMPIGKLQECTTVEVVPKAALCEGPRKLSSRPAPLPFEPTIRVQVDLPNGQKTILRVSPQLTLRAILDRICEEENLSPVGDYELRSAKSIGFPLCLDRRIEEVGTVNLAIIKTSGNLYKSTGDLLGAISRMSQEEKEKRKMKRFFGLLKKKQPAPQPDVPTEIQKVTLNGQTAVELRTPEKQKRGWGKERPVSMPAYLAESNDSDPVSTDIPKRSVTVKPKKRRAPPPPVEEIANFDSQQPTPATTSSADGSRSQHARRDSDSSSGYHGSSQPSPNAPTISDTTAAPSSPHQTSGSEKSFSSKFQSSTEKTSMCTATGASRGSKDISGVKKKQKAPPPPIRATGNDDSMDMQSPCVSSAPVNQVCPVVAADCRLNSAPPEGSIETSQNENQYIEKQTFTENVTSLGTSEKDADVKYDTTAVTPGAPSQPQSDSELVIDTSTRPTIKPTNLDESLGETGTSTLNDATSQQVISPTEQIPMSLHLETDGLLMVQTINEGSTGKDAELAPVSMSPGVTSDKQKSLESVVERQWQWQERTVILKNEASYGSGIGVCGKPVVMRKDSDGLVPFSDSSSIDEKSAVISSPSMTVQKRSLANPVSSARPGSTIVYSDPRKAQFPSMKVKSFEEEYYAKTKSGVSEDYGKTVRYGLGDSGTTAGKDGTKKNEGKLESVMGRNSMSSDSGVAVTKSSDSAQRPAAKVDAIPSGQTSSTPAKEDISVQLQREYEKLQAMFADWQFRQKQHHSIVDAGQKLTPDQTLAFQRQQEELMEQHRYVQELCARVQKLDDTIATGASASVERNGGVARKASMDNANGLDGAQETTNGAGETGSRCQKPVTTRSVVSPSLVRAVPLAASPTIPKPSTESTLSIIAVLKSVANSSKMPAAGGLVTGRTGQTKQKPSGLDDVTSMTDAREPKVQNVVHTGVEYSSIKKQPGPPNPPPPPPIVPDAAVGRMKLGRNAGQSAARSAKDDSAGDPRSELMAAIRNFGGSGALKKNTTIGKKS